MIPLSRRSVLTSAFAMPTLVAPLVPALSPTGVYIHPADGSCWRVREDLARIPILVINGQAMIALEPMEGGDERRSDR